MTKVYYQFNGDQLQARFTGTGVEDESGAHVENVAIEELCILGVTVKLESLPEDLQAAILALADDEEFEEEDSSDADDLED